MNEFDFMQVTNYDDFAPRDDEVKEYHRAMHRAFVERKADFIPLDSHISGNGFLYCATRWGIENGIIYQDTCVDEGQSLIWSFRLTSDGLGKLLDNVLEYEDNENM